MFLEDSQLPVSFFYFLSCKLLILNKNQRFNFFSCPCIPMEIAFVVFSFNLCIVYFCRFRRCMVFRLMILARFFPLAGSSS